jgi:6-phosphogluconolactonase
MLKILFVFFALLVNVNIVSAVELLYISSGSALEVKKINAQTGKLSDLQKVELAGMSAFTFSRDKKFLYIKASMKGNRKQLSIATYKVATDGRLTFIHNAPVKGNVTELKTDHNDNFITGADYGKGMAYIWKLEEGVYQGSMIQEMALEKKAHAVRFSPDNKMLMIPATGPNKIFQLAFDAQTGKVTQMKPALGPKQGAAQPRHLIFHPALNVAYSTQERIRPGVAVWTWEPKKGELTFKQNLANSDDTTARITNADLHMSPDQKFLYVSSRDKNKELDAIVTYSINPKDGSLSFVKEFPCENIPRSFCLNKSGDFIYVAGQKANMMGVYKRDKVSGHLTKVTQYETGNNPIWVETRSYQ